jgi:hypothetical protein
MIFWWSLIVIPKSLYTWQNNEVMMTFPKVTSVEPLDEKRVVMTIVDIVSPDFARMAKEAGEHNALHVGIPLWAITDPKYRRYRCQGGYTK